MGSYAKEVQVLQKQLMEVVLESLGLNPNDLQDEVESGSQVMAINCYPACPEPELALGMPPHSDFGSLTVLLQSCLGLQVLDHHDNWLSVPVVEDALIVQLGDQLEVMSNGQYKSVVHRVTVSSEKKRFSIASLHSWALEKKMGPAEKLVDQEHPASYEEFSFKDFLDYISNNDIMTAKRFIDTLKKKKKKKMNHPLKMCK
jgi:isopenicillin N synthase-like dioxygenase